MDNKVLILGAGVLGLGAVLMLKKGNGGGDGDNQVRNIELYYVDDSVDLGKNLAFQFTWEYRGPGGTATLKYSLGSIEKTASTYVPAADEWTRSGVYGISFPVTGVSPGTYDLVVEAGGYSDSAEVTVLPVGGGGESQVRNLQITGVVRCDLNLNPDPQGDFYFISVSFEHLGPLDSLQGTLFANDSPVANAGIGVDAHADWTLVTDEGLLLPSGLFSPPVELVFVLADTTSPVFQYSGGVSAHIPSAFYAPDYKGFPRLV